MKKISFVTLFIVGIFYFITSCKPLDEPKCTRRGEGIVTDTITFPDTVSLGQSVLVPFTFYGNNGCSRFDGFYDYTPSDYLIPNHVYIPTPKIIDIGCVCTEMVPIFTETYSYFPPDTGAYYFYYTIYGDIQKTDTVYVY